MTFAPVSLIMVIWQTSPFWISIIAYFFLRERIVAVEIIGMAISFGSVVLIATQAEGGIADSLKEKEKLPEDVVGDLEVIAATDAL